MAKWTKWIGIGAACLAIAGCGDSSSGGGGTATTQGGGSKKSIVIGMVAKSQSNDVFMAAYAGAKDAARTLGEKHGVEITIDWRTPTDEDANKQVEAIEALARAKADAILVSCSEGATLTPAINRAVGNGTPVMCFDSDAPNSKRFAFYGTDDLSCGQVIMAQTIKAMGGKGTVAILAGNQSAPNLQKRVEGCKAAIAAAGPDVKLLTPNGVFYHEETPEKSAEAVTTATNANPSINGWCFIGGWPLFTTDALKWAPGKIAVASCDALPAQLGYLRSGHVDTLFAQDCYGWGYKGVEVLVEKVVNGKDPAQARIVDPLTVVTKANVDEFAKKWDQWLPKK